MQLLKIFQANMKALSFNQFINENQDYESDGINDGRFYKSKARNMIKMLILESYYTQM